MGGKRIKPEGLLEKGEGESLRGPENLSGTHTQQ